MDEHADYDDGPPTSKTWCTRERWVVLVPGLVVGISLTGVWCLTSLSGSVSYRAEAWGVILAGPLSALAYGVPTCCVPIALLTAPAILAHPLRPNVWTGVTTVAALAIWFVTGWFTLLVMAFGH